MHLLRSQALGSMCLHYKSFENTLGNVFKVKETAKFDVYGMRSLSVVWKDSVDRSAMCSRPQKYNFVYLLNKDNL